LRENLLSRGGGGDSGFFKIILSISFHFLKKTEQNNFPYQLVCNPDFKKQREAFHRAYHRKEAPTEAQNLSK
jgi:hypothetical protein